MLVKIVLFLGIALVAMAGGAAGLQYLQSQGIDPVAALSGSGEAAPEASAPAQPEPEPEPAQTWLITPGGALVERPLVAAYLWQDRLAERRIAKVTRRASLADLLSPGEKLPGGPFLQAFADIRAQVLAEQDCAALLKGFAARCEMVSAKVVNGSLDASGETAAFEIELAYAQALPAAALPDLSTVVLSEDYLALEAEQVSGTPTDDDMLVTFVTGALDLCRADSVERPHCRVLSVTAARDEDGTAKARFHLAWLAPMPAGLYPAPPLN